MPSSRSYRSRDSNLDRLSLPPSKSRRSFTDSDSMGSGESSADFEASGINQAEVDFEAQHGLDLGQLDPKTIEQLALMHGYKKTGCVPTASTIWLLLLGGLIGISFWICLSWFSPCFGAKRAFDSVTGSAVSSPRIARSAARAELFDAIEMNRVCNQCREFEDLRMELNILGNNASQNIRDVRNFLAGVNNSEEMRAIAASIESAAERDSPPPYNGTVVDSTLNSTMEPTFYTARSSSVVTLQPSAPLADDEDFVAGGASGDASGDRSN